MDKRPILLLASLFAASACLAQAYRWVDDDGVVHYSDRPREGAEEIRLPKANTVSVRRYAEPEAGGDGDPAEPAEDFKYESLTIASPMAEETLWNIEGILRVQLALTPALKRGHLVRVYFDGEPQTATGTSFQIDEVWRGAHNLQAEVLDENGRLMIRSKPQRFYVQQSKVRR